MKSYCPFHKDKTVGWLCFEIECSNRVMCNLCAVKNHDKSHQIEEIEILEQKGLLQLVLSSIQNSSSVSNKSTETKQIKTSLKAYDFTSILKPFEKSMNDVMEYFLTKRNNVEQDFLNKLRTNQLHEDEAVSLILEHEQKIIFSNNAPEIQSYLDKVIEIIQELFKKQKLENNQDEFSHNIKKTYQRLIEYKNKQSNSDQSTLNTELDDNLQAQTTDSNINNQINEESKNHSQNLEESECKSLFESPTIQITDPLLDVPIISEQKQVNDKLKPSLNSLKSLCTALPVSQNYFETQIKLLNKVEESFFNVIKNYFQNEFLVNICEVVKKQIDTICVIPQMEETSQKIKHLQQIEHQWQIEYKILQESMQKSLQSLDSLTLRSNSSPDFTQLSNQESDNTDTLTSLKNNNSRIYLLNNQQIHHNNVVVLPSYSLISSQQTLFPYSQKYHSQTRNILTNEENQTKIYCGGVQQIYAQHQQTQPISIATLPSCNYLPQLHQVNQSLPSLGNSIPSQQYMYIKPQIQQFQQVNINYQNHISQQQKEQNIKQGFESPTNTYPFFNPAHIPFQVPLNNQMQNQPHHNMSNYPHCNPQQQDKYLIESIPSANSQQSELKRSQYSKYIETTPFSHQINQNLNEIKYSSTNSIEELQNKSTEHDLDSPIYLIQKKDSFQQSEQK